MKKSLLTLLALALVGSAAFADIVYITSNTSNCTATTVCGNGANPDLNINGENVFSEIGGAFTSALCSTPDKPLNAGGARYYSGTFTNAAATLEGITLRPTLAVTNGVYKVHHVFSSTANNVNLDGILGVTNNAGCTLSFTQTDKFQRSFGQPAPQQWQFLGFLTNNVDTSIPTITFYYLSGIVTATGGNRLVVDTFRFTLYELCTDVPVVGVTGPLASNLTSVVVTGVSNAATKITVYQDSGAGMVPIGSKTSDIVGGNNSVAVSGLVKGAQVAATQTLNGQEGCVPAAGALVGGGANPSIRVALSVRENTTLTGPVGAAGSGSIVSFLGASTLLTGGAPEQGVVLQPSTEWQTVSFTNGVDSFITWAGTDTTPGTWDGPFGALDGLAIACEGDNGPFEIYFDDFSNGTNGVFQDFESQPANAVAYAFSQPSYSGSSVGLMAAPNDSRVVNTAAASGTKSLRLQFQFTSTAVRNWLRFVTSGNSGAPANPQLDVNEPVSFKVLLLPPGTTPIPPAAPTLTATILDGQTVLNWTGVHRLQAASAVSGTYTNVPSVTLGPWTNNFAEPQKFFRLVD
jgi:hypothetical protein